MDGVRIIGDVSLGIGVSIWYNTVIRGDILPIRIGTDSNIQDNSVLHVPYEEFPLFIGERVTVGHAARLHGCRIEDETLIGINATVLDGAVVRSHSIVAAGAVVPPGMEVEPGVLVAGVPARPVRPVREDEIANFAAGAARYREYARRHLAEMAV